MAQTPKFKFLLSKYIDNSLSKEEFDAFIQHINQMSDIELNQEIEAFIPAEIERSQQFSSSDDILSDTSNRNLDKTWNGYFYQNQTKSSR